MKNAYECEGTELSLEHSTSAEHLFLQTLASQREARLLKEQEDACCAFVLLHSKL